MNDTDGPFETESQVRALAAVRSAYARSRDEFAAMVMTSVNTRMLTDACHDAGIQLGSYDRETIDWLSGWEPQTCAVVAGLVRRASTAEASTRSARAGARSAADVRTTLSALEEAAEGKRDRAANCADCTDHSCETCQHRLEVAASYDRLAERLAAEHYRMPTAGQIEADQ